MDLDHPLLVLDPTAADPHAEARRLRQLGACVPVELQQGVRAWITNDEATGRAAFTHPALVKGVENWRAYREGEIRQDWPLMALVAGETMVNRDGADHTRLRNPLNAAFTRRPIRTYAGRIEEIAHGLLDDLAGQPAGSVTDLKAGFTFPLPMAVICHLLGIDDPDMRDRFGDEIATILRSTATPQEVGAAFGAVMELLDRLVSQKESRPADDLATRLLQSHRDGELTRAELVDSILILVVAGHETTVNLLANAVRAVLNHPEQLALVRDGSYGWSDVVQETLRQDPPVQRIFLRFAREDVPLGGALVRAGDPVIVGMTGAGRDTDVHPDADRFDITRKQSGTPIHFGLGAHYCLGAPLARVEAEIALTALFERFPDIELADPAPPRILSHIMNSVRTLPVRLVPAG
ncbi:cytochrome P450 [Streptomyces sp. SL13]|jgi:cytochrome P450|uniref:Cytochrome P450 n=1 Tax=Streptantibioticus silvisoli TaxID=2705255 RepID=A0AA90H8U9_9ACTN|nr:cytochrome P450 [Streptantibioticus silvisoli]MDI5961151.1 cytochrome P450 [Streptantibioticus silvisoli]MDI5970955.1 cytochrome P450 [Streptantibioticus silvisoli]